MVDFADDEKSIERKRSRRQNDKQLSDLVVRTLMSSMPGRRWMWVLLSSCHLFENIAHFDESADSAYKTYFAAGERNVGLKLLSDVQRLCPREYVLSMEENAKLEKDNGGRDSSSSGNDPDGAGGDSAGDNESAE